ncbi:MAG TPA: DUF1573 domain-containing protein [Opitutaceae bacterium]|nr:DUF1573 domain-containing protein [Opitutaceae bacterium]
MKSFRLLLVAALAALVVAAEENVNPIAWDEVNKVAEARLGERAAAFSFQATNTSKEAVTIFQVRPSCGCTIVDLPTTPWVLAPGASGTLRATVDFTGKEGDLVKTLFVNSSAGAQMLTMHIKIPRMDEKMREQNQKLALADRQAVFHGDCATCHAAPAKGMMSYDLFQSVCLVCHASDQRASMVPDLLVAREHRDEAFWRKWISEGKAGTLMPAFAQKNGGPLSDAQIDSLVEFAMQSLPTEPRKN